MEMKLSNEPPEEEGGATKLIFRLIVISFTPGHHAIVRALEFFVSIRYPKAFQRFPPTLFSLFRHDKGKSQICTRRPSTYLKLSH